MERNQDIVTTFLSEEDFGEAHAFNKGLFRARGRYIKPITDDDYYYPDAMRQVIQEIEQILIWMQYNVAERIGNWKMINWFFLELAVCLTNQCHT